MRSLVLSFLTAGILPTPARLQAQTVEIQQEVDDLLAPKPWFQRTLEQIQATTGVPPLVGMLTLLAVLLAIMAAIWLWNSRLKRIE